MKSPAVSCIIPVYNGERHLGGTIDSVLGQTWESLEIIVVDDGSTDRTVDVARSRGPRVKLVQQPNAGVAAARNRGAEAASGSYLTFLDADDLCHPAKISRQMARFAARPDLEISITKFRNFWAAELMEDGARYRDHPLAQPMSGFAPPTLLVRRDAFDRVGGYDGSRRYGENMDFFLRATDQGTVIELVHDVLLRRRLHSTNLTRTDGAGTQTAFLGFVKEMLDRKRRAGGLTPALDPSFFRSDAPPLMSGDGPKVSCIVPVYNGARFLAQAIDSILAQDWRPLEVIVVDDGSTDPTPLVAGSYGDRVRLIRQKNAGPAAARNCGVEAASGEYIAFLDCDDLWDPAKITAQMGCLLENDDLGICLTHIRNFWEPEVADEEARLQDHRRTQPVPGYSTVSLLTRAGVFKEIGSFDTRLGHTDDADWFLRARDAGIRVDVLSEALVRRRLHAGNRSRTRAAHSREEYLRLAKAALDRKRRAARDDTA